MYLIFEKPLWNTQTNSKHFQNIPDGKIKP